MKIEWICRICGYVYDGEDFTQEGKDYVCPLCDQGKEAFEPRNISMEIDHALEEAVEVQENK